VGFLTFCSETGIEGSDATTPTLVILRAGAALQGRVRPASNVAFAAAVVIDLPPLPAYHSPTA